MTTKQIQYVQTRDGTDLFTDERTDLEIVHRPGSLIYHDGSEYVIDDVSVGKEAVYVYVTRLR